MKKIVVLIPTEKESVFFSNPDVAVRHCGVGMAECAATTAKVIAEDKPDLMILAGIAGAYSNGLAVGDTVAVESEVVADMGRLSDGGFTGLFQKTYTATALPDGYKAVKSNTTNCAGAIIAQPAEAAVENMEGAAFFSVCGLFGVPAMEIRTVSNRVGEKIGGENMIVSTNRLASELGKIIKSLIG